LKGIRSATLLVLLAGASTCLELAASPPVTIAGRWRLNRELTDFPKEIGFGIDLPGDGDSSTGRSGGRGGGGGRGGRSRGSGGSGGGVSGSPFGVSSVRQTEEDVRKIRELIDGVRAPSAVLTIVQTETAVTITDALNHSRTFHPNGKEETEQLTAGPVGATSSWRGGQLVVEIVVEENRRFRYSYTRSPNGQLIVETRLEERRSRNADGAIKTVYDAE
jgi:hypothetical protein